MADSPAQAWLETQGQEADCCCVTYDDGGVSSCACVCGGEGWSRGHGPQHTHCGGLRKGGRGEGEDGEEIGRRRRGRKGRRRGRSIHTHSCLLISQYMGN